MIDEQLAKLAKLNEQQAELYNDLTRSLAIESLWPGVFDHGKPVISSWMGKQLTRVEVACREPENKHKQFHVRVATTELTKKFNFNEVPKVLGGGLSDE